MSAAFTQTQKGNVIVGANITNINVEFKENSNRLGFNFNPKAAWFIKDNIAIGPEISFGTLAQKGDEPVLNYNIGAFGRKYLGAEVTNLTRSAKWFLEASGGIGGKNDEKGSSNGLNLGFGPGLAYFLSPNIALEALAKYNLNVGFGDAPVVNAVNIGLGFQIYLPGKQAKQIINEPLK
jgi:hypothetical protein